MAVFPKSETNVLALAGQMISGLNEHSSLYPSVSVEALTNLSMAYTECNNAINAQDSARAAAKNATIAKNDRQSELEEQMHKILYLAEHDCMNTPGNLDYIGWSQRKPGSPLNPPDQPTHLTPSYEGPGILSLNWRKGPNGGSVSNYRIERSDQPAGGGVPGPWTLLTTSFTENVTLQNQPRGIEMQYRIVATNAAGDSLPSNIATVVL